MKCKFDISTFNQGDTYLEASPLEVLLVKWYRKLSMKGKVHALRTLCQTARYEQECQKHVRECEKRDRERERRAAACLVQRYGKRKQATLSG